MYKNPLTAIRKVLSSGKLLFICIVSAIAAVSSLYSAISNSPDLTKLSIFGAEINLGAMFGEEVGAVLQNATNFLLVMSIISVLPQLLLALSMWLIRSGKNDTDKDARRACVGFSILKFNLFFKLCTAVFYIIGVLTIATLAIVVASKLDSSGKAIGIIIVAALLIVAYFSLIIAYNSKLMAMLITVTNTIRTGKNMVSRFAFVVFVNWFFAIYHVIAGFSGDFADIIAGFAVGAIYLFMTFLFSDFRNLCGYANVQDVREYNKNLVNDPSRTDSAKVLGYRSVMTADGEKTVLSVKNVVLSQFFGISLSSVRRSEADGTLGEFSSAAVICSDSSSSIPEKADFSNAPVFTPSVLRLFDKDGAQERFLPLDYAVIGDTECGMVSVSSSLIYRDSVSDSLLLRMRVVNNSTVDAVGVRISYLAESGTDGALGIASSFEVKEDSAVKNEGEMFSDFGITLPIKTDKVTVTVGSLIFADGLVKDGIDLTFTLCSSERLQAEISAENEKMQREAELENKLYGDCLSALCKLEDAINSVKLEESPLSVKLGFVCPYRQYSMELEGIIEAIQRIGNEKNASELDKRASQLKEKCDSLRAKHAPVRKKRLAISISSLAVVIATVTGIFIPAVVVPAVKLTNAIAMREDGKLVDAYYELKSLDSQKAREEIEKLKEEIEYFILPESVTVIDSFEFAGFNNLKEIILHENVTSIGYGAFDHCSKVERLVLPNGSVSAADIFGVNYDDPNLTVILSNINEVEVLGGSELANRAFCGCTSLKEITLPEGLLRIEGWAFEGCAALESVTLPDGLEYIGFAAFKDCTSLKEFNIPDSVVKAETNILEGCTAIEKLTLHPIVFTNLNGGVDVNSGLSHFGLVAESAGNLKEVIISSGEKIDKDSFLGFVSIEKISLPDGLKVIEERAFYLCESLAEIVIPTSLERIEAGAFSYAGVTKLVIDPNHWAGVELADMSSNPAVSQNGGYYTKASGGEEPVLEIDFSGVEKIGNYAFYKLSGIKKIELPASVSAIGNGAFYGCKELESVVLSSSLTEIGDFAFHSCESIKEITVPTAVKSIGRGAFGDCTSLVRVNFNEGLESIGYDAFTDCTLLEELILPDSVLTLGSMHGLTMLLRVRLGASLTDAGGRYQFHGSNRLAEIYDCSKSGIGRSINPPGNYNFKCNYYTQSQGESSLYTVGDFIFHKNSDGEIYLVDYNGESQDVVLPRNFNGQDYAVWMWALAYNDSIESITFSSGVKDIYQCAIAYTDSLIKLDVDKNSTYLEARSNCILKKDDNSVVLGCKTSIIPSNSSVSYLRVYAFYACTGLKEIVVPDNIKTVGYCVFEECTSLTSAYVGSDIGQSLFKNCISLKEVRLGNSIQRIPTNAFDGCISLERIDIPSSVTEIYGSAFLGCDKLLRYESDGCAYLGGWLVGYDKDAGALDITVKKGTVGIASEVFEYSNITSVKLPDGLKYIGYGAFRYCDSIKEIILPDGVLRIGDSAFAHCGALESIKIPSSTESISTSYFTESDKLIESVDGVKYIDSWVVGCEEGIAEANIRQGTYGIDSRSFENCTTLTKVTLPESLLYIEYNAFRGCSMLTKLDVPDGVKIMDNDCLTGTAITELMLPKDLMSIASIFGDSGASTVVIYYQGDSQDYFGKYDYFITGLHFYKNTAPTDSDPYSYWYYNDGVPTPWE